MQQSGTLGHTDIQHRSHRLSSPDKLCYFNGMLQCILSIACTELHPSKQLDQVPDECHVRRLQEQLPHLPHESLSLLLSALFLPSLRFLPDEFVHRQSASQERFCATSRLNRIKTGKYNCFRCIINNQIYTCQCFKCTDISSFSSDNSSLHLIIRKLYNGNGSLCYMIGSTFLNSSNDIFLCLLVCLFFCSALPSLCISFAVSCFTSSSTVFNKIFFCLFGGKS